MPKSTRNSFLTNFQHLGMKGIREGDDRGSLWYRYQLIRYQVPLKLKVLVPPTLGEGANN